MSVQQFGRLAIGWEPKTVSLYRVRPRQRMTLGDAVFEADNDGAMLLPDHLGRQLDLPRIGRHAEVASFAVDPQTFAVTLIARPDRVEPTLPETVEEPAEPFPAVQSDAGVEPTGTSADPPIVEPAKPGAAAAVPQPVAPARKRRG